MRSKIIFGFFVIGTCAAALAQQPPPPSPPAPGVATPAAPAAAAIVDGVGARIEFATNIYDFGRVKSGDPVKYTYYFTNTGDVLLELTDVHPSCGCTAAGEYTKKVEPGHSGQIPIQFNSGNFNGQVVKTVTVTSNDKKQPTVVLQLKGTIWKPIDLSPPYSVLNVPPDAPSASATVKIVNNMPEQLDVYAPELSNPSFGVELKTNQPGKEYQITISSVAALPSGSSQGRIKLKTSSTNSPSLDIPFWVNVQAPLTVTPTQLMLTPPPFTKSTQTVTIQNNSTNSVTLSEPMVNFPGVEVAIKELQPGRVFSALITFPDGFEIAQGQEVTFTAKSSNPRSPVVKVPVRQFPRRAAAQPAATP